MQSLNDRLLQFIEPSNLFATPQAFSTFEQNLAKHKDISVFKLLPLNRPQIETYKMFFRRLVQTLQLVEFQKRTINYFATLAIFIIVTQRETDISEILT